MKKIGIYVWCIILMIVLNGCGQKRMTGQFGSIQKYNYTYTADGLLYCNPRTGKAEFYDYESKKYFPLCGKANCRHQDKDLNCTAVKLARNGWIGRGEDKWYYQLDGDNGERAFYSCDLDGTNERKIGEFPYRIDSDGITICQSDSIIFTSWDLVYEEKTDETYFASGIYRFRLDSGKAEEICPQIQEGLPVYEIIGNYENKLIYREWTGKIGKKTKMIDLDSKEITEPIGEKETFGDMVIDGNYLIGTVVEEQGCTVTAFDLQNGSSREILGGLTNNPKIYWGETLKQIQTAETSEFRDWHKETYQYQENKGCTLFREGDVYHEMEVLMVKDGIVIGYVGDIGDEEEQFHLAIINLEDYLAGKTNWKLLEY